MKASTALLAAGAALLASLPILAQASTVSTDPSYYNYVSANDPYYAVGDFAVTSDPTPGLSASKGGASSSTTNNYNTPIIAASVSSSGFYAGATASNGLTYYFSVNGPGSGTTAVNITASGNISSTGSGGGSGFLTIGPAENGSTFVSRDMQSGPAGSTLISLNDTFDLTIGAIYRISMQTSLYANQNGTADVSLDPYIHPRDSNYSVTTYGGIGNLAVAPIPAALPLFISALGGLGFVGWRRRKSEQAAT